MIETGWWSQRFAPEGSVAAEGIVKQLGRPEMDPLTVLVREAAQNSWDARRDDGPVDFGINLYRLGALTPRWRETLLPPPAAESQSTLDAVLSEDSVLLVVSDRNTVGLGGPIRAGTRPNAGEKADFVQFMRNVGEPRDQEFGGGTYGFGKGIFYQLSRAGAILVDTRTSEATPSRRLMGAALGESYYVGDQRYTGRHWWGATGDIVADPLLDEHAETFGQVLGLRGFGEAESGTDIVIIAADLGSVVGDQDGSTRTLDQAAEFLGSSILWHLWPKFKADDDDRYMRFRVTVEGRELELPSPEEIDELRGFVEALEDVRSGIGVPYARTVAPKHAGSFSLKLLPARRSDAQPIVEAARPLTGSPHHVARMRTPELVVDYFPTAVHPDARLAYCAVFKSSLEADAAFALSEPPTHDAWIARGLTGANMGVVQGLTRFLNREVAEVVAPKTAPPAGASRGMGELSARLGMLIPTSDVQQEGRTDSSNRSGHGDSRPGGRRSGSGSDAIRGSGQRNAARKPRIVGAPRLEVHDEVPYFVATVDIPASDVERRVRAFVDVVVEGGKAEDEPPEGASIPQIVRWQSDCGADPIPGSIITVGPGDRTEWTVYAGYVEDAVVRFRMSELASDGGRHAQ